MDHPALAPRRRLWPVFVPFVLVVLLAAAWSGFWFYAASVAKQTMEGWREREAKAGRIYQCGSQSITGFPFRFEVQCGNVSAEFQGLQPPLVLKLPEIHAAAQVYQPTLVISEFTGPLTVAPVGQEPDLAVNWSLAQASLRGLPTSPERIAIVLEQPSFDRLDGATRERIVTAKQMTAHGRLAEGSVADNPVLDIVISFVAATAPSLHALAAQPLDSDISLKVRGLKDFAPKPWPARLRELQAADGRIEIVRARVQQGDVLAVGAGTLGLTPQGRLDGQLNLTIAGIERVLAALGVDRLTQPGGGADRLSGMLDRLAPGLGNLARERGGVGLATAGINLIGQQTELEGRKAVTLPLRFSDGAAFLGPFPIGRTPALF